MPRPPIAAAWLLAFVATIALGLPTATAATWQVPGDAPTIQAGIDSAAVGDTVLVAPGTYRGDGNRDINFYGKDVVLLSEAGPENTIIDAEGTVDNPHRGFELYSNETSAARIEGLTITGGRTAGAVNYGAGIACRSSPTIARCIIRGNWSGDSGPFEPSKAGTSRLGCGWGGGLFIDGGDPRIEDCIIEANGTFCQFGAVAVIRSEAVFERCLIVESREVGLWVFGETSCVLRNCTLTNTSVSEVSYGDARTLVVADSAAVVRLERTVVWRHCIGDHIENAGSILSVCSLVDTAGMVGDGAIEFLGPNVFTDPLFCGVNDCSTWPPETSGDYRVQPFSPCLPKNNPCGVLIGARDACDATGIPWGVEPIDGWVMASPNPFRGSTTFALSGLVQKEATLTVFDSSGRRVRVFEITGSSGPVSWDGTDDSGTRVGPGTYFLRVANGPSSSSGRVTLVR